MIKTALVSDRRYMLHIAGRVHPERPERVEAMIEMVESLGRAGLIPLTPRPATVAVTSPDGYTFLFGDLQAESGTAALASFVKSYQNSGYGLVPWRERAEVLRKGMLARVPPMEWSPDDGRAPK